MNLTITVNGDEMKVESGTTVRQLLEKLGIGFRGIAVEINQQIEPVGNHESRVVEDGDWLEIVTLVGGG